MKKLNLKNVTLIGIDTINKKRLEIVFKICEKYANFGSKKLITKIKKNYITKSGIEIINTDKVNSLKNYNKFTIRNLNKYIDTKYALIVQHDGFILNPDAWANYFLKYDYIGAPLWIKGCNIQNSGFCLMSKKLLEILSKAKQIKKFFPDDVMICKDYRKYLEGKGIRFTPERIAAKFSIEGFKRKPWIWRKYNTAWKNEFGFHGPLTNIEKWKCPIKKYETYLKKKFLF